MTPKFADLFMARCADCRRPMASHPATNPDHARRVFAMLVGTLECECCDGVAAPMSARNHGPRWDDPETGTIYGPRYAHAG